MHRTTILLGVVLIVVASAACAAEFEEYPQFRYASGLPGGSFGVDPLGNAGFEGAMQINIPIGYTPGAGNYALVPSAGAINGGFPNGFDGSDVNGTLAWGFGVTYQGYNLFVMDMMTGNDHASGESVYNAQFTIKHPDEKWPGLSLGVVDWADQRPSRTSNRFVGDGRSFFAAATWEAGTEEKPLYYTLGLGSGRFHSRPFGGVSYQPQPRLKLMAEYDGWNPNLGVAYELGRASDNLHWTLALSLIDLERVMVGMSFTRSRHCYEF